MSDTVKAFEEHIAKIGYSKDESFFIRKGWNAALAWRDSQTPSVEEIAEKIHQAKLDCCWSWMGGTDREPWKKPNRASPNQPWHDIAIAQATAVHKLIKGE